MESSSDKARLTIPLLLKFLYQVQKVNVFGASILTRYGVVLLEFGIVPTA